MISETPPLSQRDFTQSLDVSLPEYFILIDPRQTVATTDKTEMIHRSLRYSIRHSIEPRCFVEWVYASRFLFTTFSISALKASRLRWENESWTFLKIIKKQVEWRIKNMETEGSEFRWIVVIVEYWAAKQTEILHQPIKDEMGKVGIVHFTQDGINGINSEQLWNGLLYFFLHFDRGNFFFVGFRLQKYLQSSSLTLYWNEI